MTAQKSRHPMTLSGAVLEAIALIGVAGVAAAVDRSDGLVYQWSNPDMPAKPDWLQALAIDRACIAAGHTPPLHALAGRLLDAPQHHAPLPMLERVAALSAAQGDVARAVVEGLRDGRISAHEKARIAGQLIDLMEATRAALADVSPATVVGVRRESAA